MSVKVIEAIGSETGGKDGEYGDQTGNEIVLRTFKKRKYAFTEALRCRDRSMAELAAKYGKRIAECSAFGYSQSHRWTGAKNIEAVGKDNLEYAEPGDFDCSSLVIECYRLAGCPLKMTGYTGNICRLLLETGLFYSVPNDLADIEYAEIGDVINAPGIHVLMVVTDGSKATPQPEPEPEPSPEPTPVPQTAYVEIIRGRVNVRKEPAGKIYKVAKKGDMFPYLGYVEYDDTGKAWWAVSCDSMICFISSQNLKHAVLIEG